MADTLVSAGLFWITNEGLLNAIFIQPSSDGPNVNLKFMDILDRKQKDAEMNDMISIETCGLHKICNVVRHGEQASKWHIKKLLAAMFQIFHESPARTADFENVIGCCENDYPLENEVRGRRAQVVWPKLVEAVRYWQSLLKSKQPGQGKPDGNKSYQRLASSKTRVGETDGNQI